MNLSTLLPLGLRILGFFSPELAARIALALYLRPRRYERTGPENEFWSAGEPVLFPSGRRARAYGPAEGPAVWVVHGWESRASRMRALIEAAAAAGFRVIAWDGPAHGDNAGSRANMVLFAHGILEDARAFGRPLHAIVGHSLGGGASAYACRLGLPARKLVMISAPSSIGAIMDVYFDLLGLTARVRRAFVRLIEGETKTTIPRLSAMTFIAELPQDVLVVHDEKDKELPFSHAEALRAARPGASFLITHQWGHRRILDAPDVVTAVVNFLSAPAKG